MKNMQERINSGRTQVKQISHLEDRMVFYLPEHNCRTLMQEKQQQQQQTTKTKPAEQNKEKLIKRSEDLQ